MMQLKEGGPRTRANRRCQFQYSAVKTVVDGDQGGRSLVRPGFETTRLLDQPPLRQNLAALKRSASGILPAAQGGSPRSRRWRKIGKKKARMQESHSSPLKGADQDGSPRFQGSARREKAKQANLDAMKW